MELMVTISVIVAALLPSVGARLWIWAPVSVIVSFILWVSMLAGAGHPAWAGGLTGQDIAILVALSAASYFSVWTLKLAIIRLRKKKVV